MNEIKEKFTVIPAATGWYTIDMAIGGTDFILDPVIAWLITYGGDTEDGGQAFVRPISVEGTPEGAQMLQRPDGSYTDGYGSDFSTKDAVINEFNRRVDVMNEKGLAAMMGEKNNG